jgi:hypothetical protein
MTTTIVTEKDFVVIEQHSRSWYAPHIFTGEPQFKAWRKQNQKLHIVERTAARGRCMRAIDHRREIIMEDMPDFDPNPMPALNVIGRASHLNPEFAGWRKDQNRVGVAFAHAVEANRFFGEIRLLGCKALPTKQITGSDKPWNQHWLVVVENCDIPKRAPAQYFGSDVGAVVKLESAAGLV